MRLRYFKMEDDDGSANTTEPCVGWTATSMDDECSRNGFLLLCFMIDIFGVCCLLTLFESVVVRFVVDVWFLFLE